MREESSNEKSIPCRLVLVHVTPSKSRSCREGHEVASVATIDMKCKGISFQSNYIDAKELTMSTKDKRQECYTIRKI